MLSDLRVYRNEIVTGANDSQNQKVKIDDVHCKRMELELEINWEGQLSNESQNRYESLTCECSFTVLLFGV